MSLITMPDRAALEALLKRVAGDWFAEHALPFLEPYAGDELTPEGVDLLAKLTILYVDEDDLPIGARAGLVMAERSLASALKQL